MGDSHDADRARGQCHADSGNRPREAAGTGAGPGQAADMVALGAAHFSCDAHLNYLPPLWPVIKTMYGLNNAGIGLLTALLAITANFGQVLFGYLTDRLHLPHLLVIGVLVTTVFISTIGFASSLAGVTFFLMMAGVGVALFHPRAAALAAGWRPQQAAFGLAIFGATGTLGYAAGSLIGVSLHNYFGGLKGLLPSLILGLGVAVAVLIINPERSAPPATIRFGLRRHLLPRLSRIGPLLAVITLRSAAVTAFANFMPLLLEARGMPLGVGAAAVFVFIAGTGIGALAGGKLAVVIDERRLTIATLLLASPFLLLAVTATGAAAFAYLFLAGFMLRCADYVNIAQTQAIIPEGASMAAALGMGAAWGIAGLVAPVVGYFSDLHGEALALAGSAALPLLGALVALAVRFKTGD